MAWLDNLVAWWNLDEASGPAEDEYSNIRLAQTGGTVGTGTLGGRAARDFELSSVGYLLGADSAALSLGSDTAFTIAIRAQWESVPGSARMVLVCRDNSANKEWTLDWVQGTGIRFTVWNSGGTPTALTWSGFTDPTVATPYTIICWHDPSADVLGMSINDATAQTTAHSSGTRDQSVGIQIGGGNDIAGGGNWFDGLLGSCAYWKRVITSTERTQFYNSGAGVSYQDIQPAPVISTTDLVDWWDLDEASGNATGEHASIVLTQTGGTIGTGTIGGRAARDLEAGSAQYFIAADSAALSLGSDTPFTIALRIQWENYTNPMVLISRDDTSGREWLLYMVGFIGLRMIVWDSTSATSSVDWGFFNAGGGADPVSGVPYTVIAWHDPTANQIGISVNNSVPVTASHTTGTRDQNVPLQVGAGVGVGTYTHDGLIGSVAFWKRVLTSDERLAFHNGGEGVSYADITSPPPSADLPDAGRIWPRWMRAPKNTA